MNQTVKTLKPYHLKALRQLAERSVVRVADKTLVELQKLGLVLNTCGSQMEMQALTLKGWNAHDTARRMS